MRKPYVYLAIIAVLTMATASTALASAANVARFSTSKTGFRYDQKVVHVHHGRIRVVFVNKSSMKHNVNIEQGETELGKTKTIGKGATAIWVKLKAGTYNFYCSVPGHEDAGMHGTLIVS